MKWNGNQQQRNTVVNTTAQENNRGNERADSLAKVSDQLFIKQEPVLALLKKLRRLSKVGEAKLYRKMEGSSVGTDAVNYY